MSSALNRPLYGLWPRPSPSQRTYHGTANHLPGSGPACQSGSGSYETLAAGSAARLGRIYGWRRGRGPRATGEDGSHPSGRVIARQHGRHEWWGRLVKHAGLAGN